MKIEKGNILIEKAVCIFLLVLVLLVAGILTMNKNEMYGMGQDEGTYQIKAMLIMSGDTAYRTSLPEYDILENPDDRQKYLDFVYEQNNIYLPKVEWETDVDATHFEHIDGAIHGLPTFSFMLAGWGKAFGLKNMLGIQSVGLIIAIILTWMTCRNLKLSTGLTFAVSLSTALSPIVVWLGKSSLTEIWLMLFVIWILELMTSDSYLSPWLIWIPMTLFAFMHISLFAYMPMYIVLFWCAYLKSDNKGYIVSSIVSCITFFISNLWAATIASYYTYGNYTFLFKLFKNLLDEDNLLPFLLIVSIVTVIISVALVNNKVKAQAKKLLERVEQGEKINIFLLRVFLVLTTLFFVYKGFVGAPQKTFVEYLQISGFIYMTGMIAIPIIWLMMFIKPKCVFNEKNKVILGIMFLYGVIFYSCVMRWKLRHYYYYARYAALFVPIIMIFFAMIVRKWGKKQILLWIFIIVTFLPYDKTLFKGKDHSRANWEYVERMAACIKPNSALVVGPEELEVVFMFPLKTLSGCSIFYCDFEEVGSPKPEIDMLSQYYEHIYYMDYADNFENNYDLEQMDMTIEPVFQERDQLSYFDYMNIDTKLTPIPLKCIRYELPITLYEIER